MSKSLLAGTELFNVDCLHLLSSHLASAKGDFPLSCFQWHCLSVTTRVTSRKARRLMSTSALSHLELKIGGSGKITHSIFQFRRTIGRCRLWMVSACADAARMS